MTDTLFDTVQISGQDSFKFLQGQLTADLNALESSNHILSAYCNRQGQVISVFYIIKNNTNHENYTIITLGNTGELFINKIKKYAVFSKIKFEIVAASDSIFTQLQISKEIDFYIANKIPFITKETTEKYLPNELGLIELKAVSFKKGCFLGQEIIARVYYKGKPKKNIHEINLIKNESEELTTGTTISNSNNDSVGEILMANKNKILAVIQDKYIQDELVINNMAFYL